MKTFKYFIWIVSILIGGTSFAQDASVLENIEQKVFDAMMEAFKNEDETPLKHLEESLTALSKKSNNSTVTYWLSYTQYRYAIYLSETDEKRSEKLVDEAIDRISDIDKKTSEHYALLSYIRGFGMRYVSAFGAPFAAAKVENAAEKAIDLDDKNPRGYLALGTYDYYTPAAFGGGKVVEENLLKFIELPAKYDSNPYAPSWGEWDNLRMLILYYQRVKNSDEALKYCKQGMEKFPDDPFFKDKQTELQN